MGLLLFIFLMKIVIVELENWMGVFLLVVIIDIEILVYNFLLRGLRDVMFFEVGFIEKCLLVIVLFSEFILML